MGKLIGVFTAVFLAEMADKTQLATLAFATSREISPWLIFLAASAALVLSSALAVLAGAFAGHYLEGVPFSLISGILFIGIGVFSIFEHFDLSPWNVLRQWFS